MLCQWWIVFSFFFRQYNAVPTLFFSFFLMVFFIYLLIHFFFEIFGYLGGWFFLGGFNHWPNFDVWCTKKKIKNPPTSMVFALDVWNQEKRKIKETNKKERETIKTTRVCVQTMCTVKAVEFDFFSAEQIERLGVEVNTSNLYDGGLPCANGVLDTRLGAAGRTDCGVCYHGVQDCPGHLGYIRLTRPVYHPLCIDVVLKIVRCVCFWCAEVLVPDFKIPTDHQKHLSLLSQSCKNKKQCPHCEGVQPKFSKSGYFLRTTWPPQKDGEEARDEAMSCLLYTSPSPRD